MNRWWPRTEEVLLAVTSVVAVASFARLFEDHAVIAPLVFAAVAAHLVMAVTRRLGLGAPATWGVAGVAFVLLTSLALYPHTATLGVPGPATLSAVREDLVAAWRLFSDVKAPAPRSRGFLMASSFTIWLAVGLADWAGNRLRTTAEAVLPAVALFAFTAILGEGPGGVALAVALAAAIGAFALAQRVARSGNEDTWVADGAAAGSRALLGQGLLGVLAVALLAGFLVPRVPVTAQEPVVDWREGDGGGDRVTISPLVEIRSRLIEQSDRTVFTVEASRPAYWRLTSLDRFDGETWGSDEPFSEADGRLPGEPPAATTEPLVQTFRVRGLGSLWAPAAATPVDLVESSAPLRWNGALSTLIINSDQPTIDNVSYTVESHVPVLRPEDLREQIPTRLPEDVAGATELPDDLPAIVAELAAEVTAGESTPYDRARALQNWFRSEFEYDLQGTPSGHDESAIEAFLAVRRGYCEQFAGTFAAMARTLGIPARVAVGFTPGDPSDDGITYTVRGRNAHAWPEVWLPEVGWVSFEPTPGRGQPGTEAYTGVAPDQDEPEELPTPSTSAPVAPTTTVGPGQQGGAPTTTIPPSERTGTGSTTPDEAGSSGPWRWLVLAGAALVVLVALDAALIALWRRSRARARRAGGGPGARVRGAWGDAVEALALAGTPARRAETDVEFADRAAPTLGDDAPALHDLAALATAATWAADGGPGDGDGRVDGEVDGPGATADALADRITRRTRADQGWRRRLRTALDPRLLVAPG